LAKVPEQNVVVEEVVGEDAEGEAAVLGVAEASERWGNTFAEVLLHKTALSKEKSALELHTSYGGFRHEVSRVKLACTMSHVHWV
jgi:hypothetical protein